MKRTLILAAALLAAGCGGSAAPPPPPSAAPSPSGPQGTKTTAPEGTTTSQEPSNETLAKALLDEAGRREKAQPDKPEVAFAAHHDVSVRVPFTEAGRRAAARCVELEDALQKSVDLQFKAPRDPAMALAKDGRFAEAITVLKKFADSGTSEGLKRRTDAQIALLENEARRTYVEAVRAARKSVAAGAYDEAVKQLKAASDRSTSEVVSAAAMDLSLLDSFRRAEETKRSTAAEEAAQRAFGDRATRLLKRIRERAYAEVIKELDAAITDPALAACKDRLTADRAAVSAAAAFWEALQKSLKARLNQELVLKSSEGKPIRGTLKKIHETGISMRLEPPGVEVMLDSLHADSLLLLAVNRDGLAEDSPASYAAAAMWYFLEGRHAASRLMLATASEMIADLTLLEPAWRRGFFRSAIGK